MAPNQTANSCAASPSETQKLVDRHFEKVASYWRDIYNCDDVFAVIHQTRRGRVLAAIDRQRLPAGSRMLDIGCGAGVIAIELARRGYTVDAMDSVPDMVELTRQQADDAGVGPRVSARTGDAHRLMFPDNSFEVVVAMGVTPFLHSLPDALREMARVLKPDGLLFVNTDNRWRLNRLLDPLVSPVLGWLRRTVKRAMEIVGLRSPKTEPPLVRMYSRREFDSILASADFEKIDGSMIGYGPFTFMERKMLPDRIGVRLHRILQGSADRKVPFVGALGAQYMVLARKSVRRCPR